MEPWELGNSPTVHQKLHQLRPPPRPKGSVAGEGAGRKSGSSKPRRSCEAQSLGELVAKLQADVAVEEGPLLTRAPGCQGMLGVLGEEAETVGWGPARV